jgi:hypothetical protein
MIPNSGRSHRFSDGLERIPDIFGGVLTGQKKECLFLLLFREGLNNVDEFAGSLVSLSRFFCSGFVNFIQ